MKKYYIATLSCDTDRNGLVLCEYYQRARDEELVELPTSGWTNKIEALDALDRLAAECSAFDWTFYLVETEDPNFIGKERNEDDELPVSKNFKIIAKILVDEPGHVKYAFNSIK